MVNRFNDHSCRVLPGRFTWVASRSPSEGVEARRRRERSLMVLEPGTRIGRWTVVRKATPVTRRGTKMRPRLVVRCSCGIERIVFREDLQVSLKGRRGSLGCGSMRCCMRTAAVEEVQRALRTIANGDPALTSIAPRLQAQLDAWLVEQTRIDRLKRTGETPG
jgi:hypothetical protein